MIEAARTGANYVLTTGTGSGKSLAYIVPIVDHVVRNGSGRGIQAIVVYPMNALANSQLGELEKFLAVGLDRSGSRRPLHRPGERQGAAGAPHQPAGGRGRRRYGPFSPADIRGADERPPVRIFPD